MTESFDCLAEAGYVNLRPRCAGDVARTDASSVVWRDYDQRGRLLGYELLRAPREVTSGC